MGHQPSQSSRDSINYFSQCGLPPEHRAPPTLKAGFSSAQLGPCSVFSIANYLFGTLSFVYFAIFNGSSPASQFAFLSSILDRYACRDLNTSLYSSLISGALAVTPECREHVVHADHKAEGRGLNSRWELNKLRRASTK